MSVNVRMLLAEHFKSWVAENAAEGCILPDDFWVIPVPEDDPSYRDLIREGLEIIDETKLDAHFLYDGLKILIGSDREGKFACIYDEAEAIRLKPDDDWDCGIAQRHLHFLQLCWVVTNQKINSSLTIPAHIFASPPFFETDLLQYFPDIKILSVEGSHANDTPHAIAVRAVLYIEQGQLHVDKFKDEILALCCAIPEAGHDWIFDQVVYAIRSRRLSSFFLEMYKLLEFFFPMDGVFDLAKKIKFGQSGLELLEHCRVSLGWSINHQRGARAAIKYAGPAFASLCLGSDIPDNESKVPAFKEKAMEKLTEARHKLIHQDFKINHIDTKAQLVLTGSLLCFLIEAFTKYSSILATNAGEAKEPEQKALA